MADEISIGKQAIKEVQDLRAELVKLSEDALKAGKNMQSISTPSGLNKNGADNAKTGAELDALKAKYTALNETIVKKAEQSRLAEIRLQQQREKSFDDFAKKAEKQQSDELARSNKIIAQKEKEFAIFEKQFNKYEADLAKKAIEEEKASQKAVLAAKKQQLAEEKQSLARRQAFDKNSQKLAETAAKEMSAYQRIQNSVNVLTKTYNDLAIRKELGNTLSAKEESRLASLSKRINEYQTALKNTDATIQKNGRNVGNYASGYNALGNSINQLTREAPAFANSINTGFMALSNNFPALFDAISGIREQNKLLVAEGKPTTSLFKQLVAGIFSWQTLLSVGVTLLTLYGGKIVEWVISLSKVESKLQAVSNAQKLMNKAQNDAQEGTAKEITHLQLLNKTATDTSLSMNARKTAVKEMQELYPHYLGNLSEEAILTGQTSDKMALLTKNIMAAAVARGIEEEINKKAVKDYKERKLLIGEINSNILENEKISASNLKGLSGAQLESIKNRDNAAMHLYRKNSEDRLKALIDRQDTENNLLIKGYKKQVELSGKLGPDGKDEADKKVKSKKVYTTPKVKELESSLKSIGTIITQINEEIGRLTTDKIVSDESALPAINFQLEQLIKLKGQIEGMPEVDLKIVNTAVKSKEAVKQLSAEIKNYLKSFSSEFMSNSGFSETFSLLNNEIDGFGENFAVTFNAIAESAQEVFNFITNASQNNFEGEKKRLQSQYDVSLKYAGDNAAAKEKLAEDLEKKQKEIDYREAKAKQKQAIFNIAIDTAQAVVAVLPNFYLAAVVAAIGLAQGIAVASQEIPRYFMGGTHDGGVMMVNDGAGSNYRETIVTPDGKIMQPTGRNVLMDAPAGTEIFTATQWEQQLNDMLQGNGINWNNHQQSSGISKADLEDVMLRTIGNQANHHTNFDGNGVVSFIEKRGNITRSSSRRGNGKGIKF